ncbi:PEGA domain-containing protein [bacterium]|nr:PEGA domain-containing protein [bacterium]
MVSRIATLLGAAVLLTAVVFAQSGRGIIQGTLTDAGDGEPVGSGFIILEETDHYVVEYSTMTSSDGSFELVRVQPKSYRLTAVANGYDSLQTDIKVSEGDTLQLNLSLQPVED